MLLFLPHASSEHSRTITVDNGQTLVSIELDQGKLGVNRFARNSDHYEICCSLVIGTFPTKLATTLVARQHAGAAVLRRVPTGKLFD